MSSCVTMVTCMIVLVSESLEEELKESRKVRAGSGDSQDMAEEVAELVEIIKDVESKVSQFRLCSSYTLT